MPHDDGARVAHMRDAGRLVLEWAKGKDWPAFEKDLLLQAAVSYELQIVGEAAYHLSDAYKATVTGVPWDRVTTMRHRLVHDYFRVDPKILWDVVTVHLPQLLSALIDPTQGRIQVP